MVFLIGKVDGAAGPAVEDGNELKKSASANDQLRFPTHQTHEFSSRNRSQSHSDEQTDFDGFNMRTTGNSVAANSSAIAGDVDTAAIRLSLGKQF